MERIILCVRTSKAADVPVRVRFRLRDGREVDVFHKSDLVATTAQLEKFNPDGTLKPKVSNVDADLVDDISNEVAAMRRAYRALQAQGIAVNSKTFEEEVAKELDPEAYGRRGTASLMQSFRDYLDYLNGLVPEISRSRLAMYEVLHGKLSRFLTINGAREITPAAFDEDMLMRFRQFLFDEYLYVDKWPGLYTGISERNTPTRRLANNTVVLYVKALRAFFNYLEAKEVLSKTPFKKLPTTGQKNITHTQYDVPTPLTKEEVLKVLATDVPETLQATKDAFLVQCAFGFRISDFQALTMDNVEVTTEGVPYIHYLPQKTQSSQTDKKEITTPTLRFAFDILMAYGCKFPILKYPSGKSGYNSKIKDLLKHCGIDRKVSKTNNETGKLESRPLWEVASSKICRSTLVDLMHNIQADPYLIGLHRRGSEAVHHYTRLHLEPLFNLMCYAFDQKPYKVEKVGGEFRILDCPSARQSGHSGQSGQ